MGEKISEAELAERVAVIKRFKALLEKQRSKFQEYLKVLEIQENKIYSQDVESVMAHTQLESQIIEGINSLQKVIVPMRKLYLAAKSSFDAEGSVPVAGSVPIEQLQSDLSALQVQVLAQNEKNRQLLKAYLSELREQMVSIKKQNPYHARQSIYADNETGNLIHIEA